MKNIVGIGFDIPSTNDDDIKMGAIPICGKLNL